MYIILLLSVSCPVAVILMHCGASVTITNSLYVETYLANKAHSDSDSERLINSSIGALHGAEGHTLNQNMLETSLYSL